MERIQYIEGDATTPIGEGNKVIVHICNDIGGWGKGFVLAISNKWKEPEKEYRKWFASSEGFELGKVQFVEVEENLWVANIIAQHKIKRNKNGEPPIRYDAVREGLKSVQVFTKEKDASVHMPRIGCGLAGGDWLTIEKIIHERLLGIGVHVTVYDFNGE